MKTKTIQTLLFVLTLLVSLSAQGQKPIITNVSVINELGHVRISWYYEGDGGLHIRRDSAITSGVANIYAIYNPNTTGSYIDSTAKAHEKPRLYRIKNFNATETFTSDFVSTIYLTSSYDSCAQEINLKWTDLVIENFPANEWTPEEFIIHVNQSEISIPASSLPMEYSIPDIIENIDYTIYIETSWEGQDSTSNSNPVNLYTKMPESPDYINSISASADGKNTKLKFEVAPNTELNTYKVLKSDSYNGYYDTLETITTNNFGINTTDFNSEPDSKISYYKLISVNNCGNETTQTDIETINNIVLQVDNDEFTNTLNWNLLKEQDLVSANYEIYRIVSNMDSELRGSFDNFNNFQDNIESFKDYSRFCYFVRATEEGASANDYSQSNTACIYLEPEIYIPEAFTPNDDGINDIFNAKFTFIPNYFEMKIYNRWGNIVYETRNFEKGWNGKQNNGNPAPTATYIYYIKIKTPGNEIIEKRGNVTIFYP